jgi:hypothetical protein
VENDSHCGPETARSAEIDNPKAMFHDLAPTTSSLDDSRSRQITSQNEAVTMVSRHCQIRSRIWIGPMEWLADNCAIHGRYVDAQRHDGQHAASLKAKQIFF